MRQHEGALGLFSILLCAVVGLFLVRRLDAAAPGQEAARSQAPYGEVSKGLRVAPAPALPEAHPGQVTPARSDVGGAVAADALTAGAVLAQPATPKDVNAPDVKKEISGLIERLRSDHASERFEALAALYNLGDAAAPAVPVLVGLLGDKATQRVPDRTVLGYHERCIRDEASRMLARLGPPALAPLLAALKAGPDSDVGSQAARTLHEMFFGSSRAVRKPGLARLQFETWLDTIRDAELRAAADRLKGTPEGDAVARLLAAFDDCYRPIASYYPPGTLKRAPGPEDLAPLIAALDDKDGRVRGFVVNLLGEMRAPEGVEPLIEALGKGGGVPVRSALGKIGAAAVEPLVRTIADPRSPARDEACWALYAISDPNAVPVLLKSLKHPDAPARAWVAKTLAGIPDPRAIDPLIDALRDEDTEVRISAAWTLRHIPEARPRAVEPLRRLLKTDPAWGVRMNAAASLGYLGANDRETIEALERAVGTDAHVNVRRAAVEALARLRTREN